MPATATCVSCETDRSNYKCPTCRAPYCSVKCFKTHRETPCAKPSVAEPAVEKPAAEIERNAPVRRFEEDSEDELGSRLRRDALERIATSERVRELLRDSRIRAVVRAIDDAQDGSRALELAREDPEFRAFTETLLDQLN